MINNKPIGVFDSGIGGVTVLDKIVKEFPNEEYIYLGDTRNCPYGIKTKEQIMGYVKNAIKFLEKSGCKMVVIGCNTATVNSYEVKSDLPIIRIIEPTAKAALAKLKKEDEKIIVLATNYTIDAKGYERFLGDKMIGVRSSDFVPIVEKGLQSTSESYKVAKDLLSDVKGKGKVVILGCTHFGLVEKDIRKVLGEDIETVESSSCINDSVRECLDEIGFHDNNTKTPNITINVTGDPNEVKIDWFKKEYKGIYKVDNNYEEEC